MPDCSGNKTEKKQKPLIVALSFPGKGMGAAFPGTTLKGYLWLDSGLKSLYKFIRQDLCKGFS